MNPKKSFDLSRKFTEGGPSNLYYCHFYIPEIKYPEYLEYSVYEKVGNKNCNCMQGGEGQKIHMHVLQEIVLEVG